MVNYEIVDNIKVTIVTDKDAYTVGEPVKVAFRIDNLNQNYEGAEVTIKYYDNKGNSKIIIAEIGGYGTSVITEPFSVTAEKDLQLCFEIQKVIPITAQPVISVEKVVWGGVTVWKNGRQVAFPIIPVKAGVARYAFGIDWKDTGVNVFKVPEIHVAVSKAAYGDTCTVYYANHGGGTERSCGGEPGASAVLPQGKVSVLTGYHDKDAEDWCYLPMAVSFMSVDIVGDWDFENGSARDREYIESESYTVTLQSDFDALIVFVQTGPGRTVKVYHNNVKIATGTSSSATGQFVRTLYGNFRAGDTITVSLPDWQPYWYLTVGGAKVVWTMQSASHRIYLDNDSNLEQMPIEFYLRVYSVPDTLVVELVNKLKAQGLNIVILTPSRVVYS